MHTYIHTTNTRTIHPYIRMNTCTYAYTLMHTYSHAYIHIHIHIYTYIHAYMKTHTFRKKKPGAAEAHPAAIKIRQKFVKVSSLVFYIDN